MKTIEVLQYNTHLFLDSPAGDVDPDLLYEDELRIQHIVERLRASGADVVTLDEVWADSVKKRIADGVADVFPCAQFQPAGPLEQGSGLLVLSRLLLDEAKFFEFSCLSGPDRLSQKGLLKMRVALPERGFFYLIATHTQSGEDQEDKICRDQNRTQIVNEVKILLGTERAPVIVSGDLNVVAEEVSGAETEEYRKWKAAFAEVGMIDLFRTLHPQVPAEPGYTYDGKTNDLVRHFAPEDADAQQRIDYIFASSGDGVQLETAAVVQDYLYPDPETGGRSDLSDHFPLRGRIAFP